MTSSTVQNAEAVRFTADLKQNKWMAGQWQALLDDAKALVGDQTGDDATKILQPKILGLDNFIAEQGYDTTAAIILNFLKSDLYQTYLGLVSLGDKSSDSDARSFVQKLLTDPAVARDWQSLLAKVSKGQATGDDLNGYMSGKGFTCTFMQVNAAFQEMRDHNVIYWSGSYRTRLTDAKGSRPGPIVVVSSPFKTSSAGVLSIGQDILDRTAGQLKYANGVLSWKAHPISWDPDRFGEKCAGTLTFSAITQDSAPATAAFGGGTDGTPSSAPPPRHVFTAQLAYFDGLGKPNGEQATLSGWLDVVSDQDPSIKPGAGAANSQFPAWVNYLLNGLMVVQMLHSFLGKKQNLKDGLGDEDQAYAGKADGVGDAIEGDGAASEAVSPFASEGALEGSTLVNALKAEQQGFGGPTEAEVQDAVKADADFDAATDSASAVEGEGWGSDLADLGAML